MVRCWRGLEEVPADWNGGVVTVGVFDGVHRGHQRVLERAGAHAREREQPVVAVTFDPPPVRVLAPDKAPPALTDLPTRVRLLGRHGADAVLVLPFTRELSQLSPEEFITTTLVDSLGARAVVVGEDFRFGRRAAGDVALLRKVGGERGFAVEGVAPVGEGDVACSSSLIRRRVAEGDVAGAAELLGRPHAVFGPVETGDGRGREMLGYPTANVAAPGRIAVPADGVYAGWLWRVDDDAGARLTEAGQEKDTGEEAPRMPAAISIGTNPTFSGVTQRVEVYVLDRDDLELYGVRVAVEFAARLRDTLRFDSPAALVEAMDHDVRRARDILAG